MNIQWSQWELDEGKSKCPHNRQRKLDMIIGPGSQVSNIFSNNQLVNATISKLVAFTIIYFFFEAFEI